MRDQDLDRLRESLLSESDRLNERLRKARKDADRAAAREKALEARIFPRFAAVREMLGQLDRGEGLLFSTTERVVGGERVIRSTRIAGLDGPIKEIIPLAPPQTRRGIA